MRGFTILTLARYFAERFIEDSKAGEQDALPIFLRMEQIGALGADRREVGNNVTAERSPNRLNAERISRSLDARSWVFKR